MFHTLKENLMIESRKPTNSILRNELLFLIQQFGKQFSYKENDFLIIASLLDPRYTFQIEDIFGLKFKDFIPKVLEFAQDKNEEIDQSLAANNEKLENSFSESLSDTFGHIFWKRRIEKSSQLAKKTENWKYVIEVKYREN